MENYKRGLVIIVLSFLVFVLPSFLYAEDEKNNLKSFNIKNGTYLEIFGVQNRVGKDFYGTYLTSTEAVADVPDVDPGGGFGISLGQRGERGAFEISYQRSDHDTHSYFTDIGDQKGYLNIIDFNIKVDVCAKERVRPYFLLGFGFPWLTITDSYMDVYDDSLQNETFLGISGNVGCGLAYFLTPRLCITGGMAYRWMFFTSVKGYSIEENLSAGGPCLRLGLAYTF